ncbi:hypothetical protein BCM35_08045 [Helicobacter winghamensis]|uniref:S6 family peptidase n=2 Tax=Helicobacter winghamensis TaxID=157268 RepID=UPI000CB2C7CE|nr:S6 family peptidase [Helicobacter winghamensis]PKT76750.1 hypothetical protein BCM35_08045 [Helicobacter winghamensis]PKT76871.1 hypothetical protein BCM34_01795 [Helicobacter winghamensis]
MLKYKDNKKIIAVIVLSNVLISGLNAQIIYADKFFYRDFLDLGQNKGAFSAGAENVVIHSSKTPGVSMSFEAPIIDQSARSNNGNSTALGRNFVITATHVVGSSGSSNNSLANATNAEVRRWGQTSYTINTDNKSKNYGFDVSFARFNKYIVEGETEIFDAGLQSDTSTATNPNASLEAANLEKLKEYLKNNATDSNGNLLVFQAGSGTLSLLNAPGGGFSNGGIAAITGTRGGSLSGAIDFSKITYQNSKANENVGARGLQIVERTDLTWVNSISPGDSGSGFYIYDKSKGKWLLLGVTAQADFVGGGTSAIAVATKEDFEKYKKQNEQEIDLKGSDWTYDGQGFQNGAWIGKQNNKDLVFSNGGSIETQKDIRLLDSGQIGGFVFKAKDGANATNPTIYKITSGTQSNGKLFGFDGAGLDIDENVKVEWGLGFISGKTSVNDSLHKVGKGTLEIKTGANAEQGYLRVGDGKVIFNTEHQAFKGVYLTSGRGTLELIKDKAQAFGAVAVKPPLDSQIQHHFKLEQNDVNNLGIYFGNGGGNLDLKGNSLTLNAISSNDSRANIINTDTQDTSYMTIEGLGYENKKKTQNKANTIIHASFGQSIDSKNDNADKNNNINLIYKGDDKTSISDDKKAALVFDGNVNAKGLEVDNGKVVLQGHPTTHAYIRNENITTNLGVKNFLELVKKAEGSTLPSWMDLSRPSTLEQPDWDHRVFKIGTIDLQNSRLDVGREATLEGKIKADSNSAINFGGDIEHYIDKKDGENTTGNGFEYQQIVEKNKLKEETQKIANQTIQFKGEIEADGTKINSSIYDFNAKLDLKNQASLKADFLTLDREMHKSGVIISLNNSTAEIKNLIFKGIQNSDSNIVDIQGTSKLEIAQSLGFEKSTFDLSNLNSMGNFTKPTSYDIFVKDKSTITGTSTAITGNVGVMSESSLSLKSIMLKDTTTQGQESKPENLKNSIIVEGKESKLQVQDKISSTNQDNTLIVVNGFRETTNSKVKDVVHSAILSANGGIELQGTESRGLSQTCNGDKSGVDCFNDKSMNSKISNIVLTTGGKIDSNLKATNLQLNVNVDKDSSFLGSGKTLTADKSSVALNFELGGKEQEFNIDAKQKSHITLTAHAKESLAKDSKAFEKALESSQYKGKISADNGSKIDSNLSNITASVDLKGGASLNVKSGGILTLKDNFNSISLSGANTALNVGTIVAESLSNLALNVGQDSKFNVTNFVFKGGSVSNDRFYGENVWLQDSANVTLNQGGTIAHNLYIDSKSIFNTNPNEALLSGGKKLLIGGESSFKVANGSGTLGVNESGETIIQTEIGSKLEINKLLAQNGSKVYVSLDLDKVESKKANSSEQKNFNIEATNGSNVYVNSWDMNRQSFSSGKTSLITDESSRIHFGIFKHNMANQNYIESPIKANLTISQHLSLENVGKPKPSAGNKAVQNSVSVSAMTRDITSETATMPTNQTFSESDPLKLATQAGTNDDRFHALKLEGNTLSNGVVQNTGKNLTLENGTRIDVKLDESIKAPENSSGGDFQLNKYYTLISAGSITDNRTDKRIYFDFANGNAPLYWVTLVENGEVKVKFIKEDPSSYKELSKYINNDRLLEILIQHNPQDSFVQMAGTASQYKELEGYLGAIDKDMERIAKNSVNTIEKVLWANNQSINTRIIQVRHAQKHFAITPVKLASNDTEATSLAIQEIESMREKNNMWLNTSVGAFVQGRDDEADINFYSTNIGYDRLFDIGDDELILGVMAGFGKSNYDASIFSDNSTIVNFGVYGLYQTGNHEIQSNLSISSIRGDRSMQGVLGSEKAHTDSLGLLSHNYYKYNFLLKKGENFESLLKPVGLLSLGYDSIGDYRGTNYAQQSFESFNVGLGTGVEYALVNEKNSYIFSLLAKKNLYNSADQVFVSLSNAQNFIGYELNPEPLTFQLDFIGKNQFDNGFALQYGFSVMSDVDGGYGGKGNISLEYKF